MTTENSRLRDAGSLAILILYTLLLCVPAAFRFDGVSLYDEITHFDYAYKLTVEHAVPKSVEPLAEESLEAWACRESDWGTAELCDLAEEREATRFDFPVDGVNYNGFHPVVYYAVTGWGAQALTVLASPFADLDLFDAMRVMSSLWLAAGISAFYLVLRRWIRTPGIALGASLLLVSLPAVTLFGFTISPDAAAPLAGAAAIAIASRLAGGRLAFAMTAVLTFLVASTKLLSIVAILSVVTVGLLYSLPHLTRSAKRVWQWAGPFAGALLGAGLSYAGAALVSRSAGPSVIENPAAGLSTEELTESAGAAIADTFATHVGLTNPYWFPDELNSPEWAAFSRLIALVVIAIPFIIMWLHTPKSREFILGLSLLAGVLTVPVLIQIREIATRDEYFLNVAPRYSLSLVPLAVACMAIFVDDRRSGRAVTWTIAGLSILLALGSTNGIFTV